MNKKYPCEQCKQSHRRNALVKIHDELLCRNCLRYRDEVMPGKSPKLNLFSPLFKRKKGLVENPSKSELNRHTEHPRASGGS